MRIVGITGGIGSGKSTASTILKKKGYKVIDADEIAKSTTEKNKESYIEILEYFGEKILLQDGTIDRKSLANIVFNDDKKLEALNGITHKNIRKEIERQIGICEKKGEKIIFLDVPLLFEVGLDALCDRTALVYAPKEDRIERVLKRDGLSRKAVEMRIKSQLDDEIKKDRADYILDNTKSVENLEKEIERLLEYEESL